MTGPCRKHGEPMLNLLPCCRQSALVELSHSSCATVPLAYTCGCAYFALFKLGNFSFYRMVSLLCALASCVCNPFHALPSTSCYMVVIMQVPHYTDGFSLLLNASLLARFAAPLCFNFLYCLRMQHLVSSETWHVTLMCLAARLAALASPPSLRGAQDTIFLAKMGAGLQNISFLGNPFNTCVSVNSPACFS